MGSRWQGRPSARSAISSRSAFIRTRTSRRSKAARSSCNDADEARRVEVLRFHGIERQPRRHARRRVSRRQVQPARRQCADRRSRSSSGCRRFSRTRRSAGRSLLRALRRPNPRACCRRARTATTASRGTCSAVLLPLDRLRIDREAFRDALARRASPRGISYEALHLCTLGRRFGYHRGRLAEHRADRRLHRHAAAARRHDRRRRRSGLRCRAPTIIAANAACDRDGVTQTSAPLSSPLLSVVIPVYNEEAGLPALFARLYPALDALQIRYEVIFVNDGSRDQSAALLQGAVRRAARRDARRASSTRTTASTSRSSPGSSACAASGSSRSTPTCRTRRRRSASCSPRWTTAPITSAACAASREDSWWRRRASRLMNRLRERITRIRMTDQGCMLRAYSRDIVDAVAAAREVSTYIPALAYTFAHHPAEVDVLHEERAAGESKYSLYRLIRLNFDLITGFSLVPLQLFSVAGMLVALSSVVLYVVVIVAARDRRRLHRGDQGVLGSRHPRVLPDRLHHVRRRSPRRIRGPHLPAGARPAALRDPRRARTRRRHRGACAPGCRERAAHPLTSART